MSLDVYLTRPTDAEDRDFVRVERIFIRENGQTREVTRDEWDAKFPGAEPVTTTSDDPGDTIELYSANITHNLGAMAKEAGIYQHLWRPEELGITKARELIEPLRAGLALMRSDPARFEAFNAKNGWGLYEHFVPWIQNYLTACMDYPDADVNVSR